MKKSLIFPLLIVSLLSVPSLLFAQEAGSGTEKPAVSVANNTKTAAPSGTVSQEVLPTPPSEESAARTQVGGNCSYEEYFDTRSLQYDEQTGIITIWI